MGRPSFQSETPAIGRPGFEPGCRPWHGIGETGVVCSDLSGSFVFPCLVSHSSHIRSEMSGAIPHLESFTHIHTYRPDRSSAIRDASRAQSVQLPTRKTKESPGFTQRYHLHRIGFHFQRKNRCYRLDHSNIRRVVGQSIGLPSSGSP